MKAAIDMSGTRHYVSLFPAGPLAPHLALKNPVLGGGVVLCTPRLRGLDLSQRIKAQEGLRRPARVPVAL